MDGEQVDDAKVRKRTREFDIPRWLSPGPTPEPMEGIEIRTPGANTTEALSTIGNDAPRHARVINVTDMPFFQFHSHLDRVLKHVMQASLKVVRLSDMQTMLQVVIPQILEPWVKKRTTNLEISPMTWEAVSRELEDFPIPLRKPNQDSAVEIFRWFIELFLIGSANNLLKSYHGPSLEGLIDSMSTGGAVERFLVFVKEFNLYAILEKIIDLNTDVTASFAAKALVASIKLEDERLQNMLLTKRVPVDGVQTSWLFAMAYGPVSAIHLAVEQQNESLIRHLLEAGIDPDGYVTNEWDYRVLKPLSRLLYLYSVKTDSRVVQISNSILKALLDAQRHKYDNHHCELYVVSLFIRAWIVDAPAYLRSLRDYCYALTSNAAMTRDRIPLRAIAHNEDADFALQKILQHPPFAPEGFIEYGYEGILSRAIQKRSPEILRVLYSEPAQNIFHCFCPDRGLACRVDPEAVSWLLQQDVKLPEDLLGEALYATFCSEGVALCKTIIDREPKAFATLTNSRSTVHEEGYAALEMHFSCPKDMNFRHTERAFRGVRNEAIATLVITSIIEHLSTPQADWAIRAVFLYAELDFCRNLIAFLILRGRSLKFFECILYKAIKDQYP